jgi:decaprenylphospho-beta-D-ribofuranose 2-oxidase
MQTPIPQTIRSYGGLYEGRSELYYPDTVAEIIEIYDMARREGRRVAFRGRGYSFDRQGLDSGLLISLDHFAEITIDVAARQATVGAGAIWGDILAAAEPHGLVPAVMVSTSYASAGGTLSACCISRFSPTAGKEGKWIARFTIITPDGQVRQCSRTEHSDLFYAAIGGFGYFGAVVAITYDLLYVGIPARVRTQVTLKPHHYDLHADLLPPRDMPPTQTVYSAFAVSGDRLKVMYCHTRYSNDSRLVPMMPHRPMINGRLFTEFMVQWIPAVGQLFWNYAYHVYIRLNDTYVDPTHDYTFFMDGNVRAKRLGKRLGMRFRAIQQTFVLPLSEQVLNDFLAACVSGMKAAGTPPAMIDALCLPADGDFLLSSTRGRGGYAVSIAFESLTDAKIKRITHCLEQLTGLCREMGGRIHLTKNVLARPADVQAMYADVIDTLYSVKEKYDPDYLLASSFIEHLLGRDGDSKVA